jgi:transposase
MHDFALVVEPLLLLEPEGMHEPVRGAGHVDAAVDQVLAVTSSLAVLDCLSHQIKTLEQTVHKRLKHTPSYEQLLTVDGIGTILAQTIALETGTIGRFPTVGNYASYCRCVDSTKISNGKRKGQGNVKNGNPYLGWAYAEAAHFARRFNPKVQRYYQRKQAQTNVSVAHKAVAHKLARACYHMMRQQVPFNVTQAFG